MVVVLRRWDGREYGSCSASVLMPHKRKEKWDRDKGLYRQAGWDRLIQLIAAHPLRMSFRRWEVG